MSEKINYCERMIPHSNSWSKWKKKCTKPAVGEDDNKRKLCVKCLKKHNERLERSKIQVEQYKLKCQKKV